MRMRFGGIDNVNDPKSLASANDDRSVTVQLTSAVNLCMTRRRKLVLRPGYTRVAEMPFHSPFGAGGVLYGVYNGGIYRDIDVAPELLLALGSDAPICWMAFPNGWLIFSNGDVTGYVENGVAQLFPYPVQSYESEAGTMVPSFKSPLPGAVALEHLFGHLFLLHQVGDETWLVHTDAWDLDGYRQTDSFLHWPGAPELLVAVDDGLWVSAGGKIFWVTIGEDDHGEIGKAEYGAIPGTARVVMVEKTGFREAMQGEKCAVVATQQGICLLGNGGTFINISQGRYAIPIATEGSALIRERNGEVRYIAVLRGMSRPANGFDDRAVLRDPTTVCVDLSTGEHTEFTEFAFSGFASTPAGDYGVNDGGVFALGGGLDDGIPFNWSLATGEMELGSSQTRLPEVHVTADYDRAMSLRALPDGKPAVSVWGLHRDGGTVQRFKLPKGAKGRYWSVKLSGLSNATGLTLHDADLLPVKLGRTL